MRVGLAAPRWLERIVSGTGIRFSFLILLLFLPFAIEALIWDNVRPENPQMNSVSRQQLNRCSPPSEQHALGMVRSGLPD